MLRNLVHNMKRQDNKTHVAEEVKSTTRFVVGDNVDVAKLKSQEILLFRTTLLNPRNQPMIKELIIGIVSSKLCAKSKVSVVI